MCEFRISIQAFKIKVTGWLTWNNTSAVILGSPGRGVDSSLKSSHSRPGITRHGLHTKRRELFSIQLKVLHVWVCLTHWQRCLTSTKVGCYVLKLVYLTDSLSSGEVKDQDPVAWGDVLQAEMEKTVTNITWMRPKGARWEESDGPRPKVSQKCNNNVLRSIHILTDYL